MQESHIPEKYYAFINEKVDRQKNKKLESEVNWILVKIYLITKYIDRKNYFIKYNN